GFVEKPKEKEVLEKFRSSTAPLKARGIEHPEETCFLGSMGIYLFKRQALIDLLREDPREDFGKHLIPTQIQKGGVSAFLYGGYWEDIGTIEAFYEANLALTDEPALFNCYDEKNVIFTGGYSLPGPKIRDCHIRRSIICEGSQIDGDEVTHSVLGTRSVVKKGSIIRDSYVMGNDYYSPPVPGCSRFPETFGIGEDCIIQNAIIDKNAHIGRGVQLINKKRLTHYNGDNLYIRDGIIIVTRGATIPDGFVL
ncbi:MAG: glucose-1-phosphate adenylyltransferase, partial [Chlamydiia bacterium]|nr:glucose-1-phosphate adenylyltransferase [Chlamydiia bacterium]